MKTFVDYTNWKGVREWREIQPCPLGQPFTIQDGRYNPGDEHTMIMHVTMVDRGNARRTLRIDHIHGFRVEK